MEARCLVVAYVYCWCGLLLCVGGSPWLFDGPYYMTLHCFWGTTVLDCTDRGANTIQVLDVTLRREEEQQCNYELSSNSTPKWPISNSACHNNALRSLQTVCGNKGRCDITRSFLSTLNCTSPRFAWITYKCRQENYEPQSTILCIPQTVITQPMCQPGTAIGITGAMFADEVGTIECDCCSRFGDCFLDADNETMAAIHAACDGKQTCDELKLNIPTGAVRCESDDMYLDYTAIYYKCIPNQGFTTNPPVASEPTRSGIDTSLAAVTLELTSSSVLTPSSTKLDNGSEGQHETNLGVAVGVPVALLLIMALVTTVVLMVLVKRRQRVKQACTTGDGNHRSVASQPNPNTIAGSRGPEVEHTYVNDQALRIHGGALVHDDNTTNEYETIAQHPTADHYEALTGNVSIPAVIIYENTHAATYEQLQPVENSAS